MKSEEELEKMFVQIDRLFDRLQALAEQRRIPRFDTMIKTLKMQDNLSLISATLAAVLEKRGPVTPEEREDGFVDLDTYLSQAEEMVNRCYAETSCMGSSRTRTG